MAEAPLRYTCKYLSCGKVYASSDAVRKHAKKHHPEWLKQCELERCEKRRGEQVETYCITSPVEPNGAPAIIMQQHAIIMHQQQQFQQQAMMQQRQPPMPPPTQVNQQMSYPHAAQQQGGRPIAMNASAAEAEHSGTKRQRADEDDRAASLQALLDAMMEPGIPRLRAYAELSGLPNLIANGSLQAHVEHVVTSSSVGGVPGGVPGGGPVEGIDVPPAIVKGLVLICQELVAFPAASREAVSARKKLTAFAWLLADVMGQVAPWHSELALAVGKRLERSLHSVHVSLAEQRTALAAALQADDVGAASLAQAAIRNVLSAPTHCAIVELELPKYQAKMASASLALLAARGIEAPPPPTEELATVLDAISRLTQGELWQVVERAQDVLKVHSLVTCQ